MYNINKLKILILGFVVLFLVPLVSAVDICEDLTTSKTLSNNVSSEGTCFNVTADHVVLNCNGYWINYSQSVHGHAVNITNHNNITIKNCNIVEGQGATFSRAIQLENSSNCTIYNNTITTYTDFSYGVNIIQESDNNNISFNTINSVPSAIHIWDETGDGTVDNIIHNNYLTSGYDTISIDTTPNDTIRDNIIVSGNRGIMILGSVADNVYISGNNITAVDDAITVFGDIENTTIRNNRLTSNSTGYGISLTGGAGGTIKNKIYNNLINGSSVPIELDSTPEQHEWNTTNQTGTRIYSNGTNIGGNYYTNSSGNGYSDTCTDSDTDGFCDSAYDVKNDTTGCTSNNCDYLPLSDEYSVRVEQTWYDASTKLWYVNVTVPSGSGLEDLYLQAEYTTDSTTRDDTETNAISFYSAFTRLVSMVLTISDYLTRMGSFFRLETQGLNWLEIIDRLFISFRKIIELFNINEFIIRIQGFVKTITQTLNINDLINKLSVFGRTILQSININDFVSRLSILYREILDSFNISDLVSKFKAVSKIILETLNINDFIARLAIWYRDISETLNISDFIYKLPDFIQTITQSLNINDFISRLSNLFRSITESINIIDLVYKFGEVVRRIIEIININDFIERLSISFRSIIETLNITDFIIKIKNLVKLVSETLNVNDFISRLAIFFRIISEPFSILIRLLKTLITAAPTITIDYPEANEYYFEEEPILLDATATTTGNLTIDTWWFNVGNASGNITFTPPTNMSLEERIEYYTVTVWANDSGGGVGSDSVNFFVISKHNAYFYFYLFVFLFLFLLILLGFGTDDHVFTLMAGFLLSALAINLYVNGFPLLDNEFLEKSMLFTFIGTSFYLMAVSGYRLIRGGREK